MVVSSVRVAALMLCVHLVSGRNVSEDYHKRRSALVEAEMKIMLGGQLKLSADEDVANQHLMRAKYNEMDANFSNESNYSPGHDFIDRKADIEKSLVFEFIRQMPKGAVLHVHDTGMIGYEYVIKNITYRSGLYVCRSNGDIMFKFSSRRPRDESCEWELLQRLREASENVETFDRNLAKYLSLEFMDPAQRIDDYVLWKYFIKIFEIITPLLTYKPVFEDYFYEAMRQYREDKILYVELRTTLPALYEMNGTLLDPIETAKTYKRVSDKFVRDYPDSLGSRIIYAPARIVDPRGLENYLDILNRLRDLGDYVAGFDLVGEEDTGKPLLEYADQLLQLVNKTNVFYHAGETNWFGTTTDFNLYDALLLGAKRIGHGFALPKHPIIAGLVKERDIAIEVNPISNQVLKLVDDMRNHPASIMVAQNIPLVVSSDDPGLWGALPLSHDLYEMFMGIASRHSDIRLLKQLVLNSFHYSSMKPAEKDRALKLFSKEWDLFIKSFVSECCVDKKVN